MNNVSPLRYPGGKTRAREKLLRIFIDNFDYTDYDRLVSPYFGGGSFEFHIQNKFGYRLLANDKFFPLYLFWDSVKYSKAKLVERLRQIKVTKELFMQFRQDLMCDLTKCEDLDELDIATKFFVINRCSFSGATLSGGYSQQAAEKRFTASSIDRVEALDLTYFQPSSIDGCMLLQKRKVSDSDFIFADPPYCLGPNSKLYGRNGDLHEGFDHAGLAMQLRGQKNWMVTYNDCPEIRALYAGYKIIPLEWSYGMNASKKSSEIVILSIKVGLDSVAESK